MCTGVTGGQSLQLDHYLEILQRKPGAFSGSTALVQARAGRVFTAAHEAFWAAARKAGGDSKGTQALIEVLLLHRHLAAVDVIEGITAALSVGCVNPDVIAVQARKAAAQRGALGPTRTASGRGRRARPARAARRESPRGARRIVLR